MMSIAAASIPLVKGGYGITTKVCTMAFSRTKRRGIDVHCTFSFRLYTRTQGF